MKLQASWNSKSDIEIHLDRKPLPVKIYPIEEVKIMLRMTMQNWVDADELRYCVLDYMDQYGLVFSHSWDKSIFPYNQEVEVRVSDPITGIGGI